MSTEECIALGELAELSRERVSTDKDQVLPYLGLEHLAPGTGGIIGSLPAAASTSTNSVFHPGDVLFGKLRPNLRKVALANFDGYCSTDILVLRPLHVEARFLAQVLRWRKVADLAVRTAAGTKMPRTSWDDLKRFVVDRNVIQDQIAVGSALVKVDEAIAAHQRILDKFAMMRQGLLRDLVSSVSEHSQVIKLDQLASVAGGVTLGRVLPKAGTIELPYLRVANVQDGYLDLEDVKTVRILAGEVGKYLLHEDDLLVLEANAVIAHVGRSTIWKGEIPNCIHQNHVFRVRCDHTQLVPRYLDAVFASDLGRRYFRVACKQTTLATVNSTQLKAFPVPWVPVTEQQPLVDAVQAHDSYVAAVRAERDKLAQLREGLSDDLLTGRVRAS